MMWYQYYRQRLGSCLFIPDYKNILNLNLNFKWDQGKILRIHVATVVAALYSHGGSVDRICARIEDCDTFGWVICRLNPIKSKSRVNNRMLNFLEQDLLIAIISVALHKYPAVCVDMTPRRFDNNSSSRSRRNFDE